MIGMVLLLTCGLLQAQEDAMAPQDLDVYYEKRDFALTPEPEGTSKKQKKRGGNLFMIHKHDARRLHFDLRVQLGSVLASWAVPKGPSLNPKDKRLAVHVEDHPLAYADFEGVIPEGQYGAGAVMIWDYGTYENRTKRVGKPVSLKRAIQEGRIELFLQGQRIQGLYALVRMNSPTQEKEQWLLIKMQDEYASTRRNPVKRETKSVISGRTMRQISQASPTRARDAKRQHGYAGQAKSSRKRVGRA